MTSSVLLVADAFSRALRKAEAEILFEEAQSMADGAVGETEFLGGIAPDAKRPPGDGLLHNARGEEKRG